jgi:hypothetical protein
MRKSKQVKNTIDSIDRIGIKAYSLLILKEKGLFEEKLYVSSDLPKKEEFIEGLKNVGFKDGDEMAARFSHPSKVVNLPRKICTGFDEMYQFYETNMKDNYTIMIHDLIHAKYGGTISWIEDELVMEFTEGDWNSEYCLNTDTAMFKNGVSTWYLYKEKRKVAYVDKQDVKSKFIDPIDDKTAKAIFGKIAPKISTLEELLKGEFNTLEFLIDDNLSFKPLKLLNIFTEDEQILQKNKSKEEIFELKTPHDLKKWDKKTKLLISIPATEDRADALIGVISEIKKYTDSVYIGYGILSHPAILLREAGISVERKVSNFRVLEFNY